MDSLRQFLYLDEYKIYSLYSQLLKGFPDHIVRYKESGKNFEESRRLPIIGWEIDEEDFDKSGHREKRFLHDFSFSVLETELEKESLLHIYNPESLEEVDELVPGDIIRVNGSAQLNDTKEVRELLSQFNKIGLALTNISTHAEKSAALEKAEQQIRKEPDRNKRAKMKALIKESSNVKRLAQEIGLRFDEKYLEDLVLLLDYGLTDHIELQIHPFPPSVGESPFFSALLKRDSLREEPSLLTKKFSRRAQGEFYLLGIVCQSPSGESTSLDATATDSEDLEDSENLRDAITKMILRLCDLDNSFMGRYEQEIIIDPLAVYRKVNLISPQEIPGKG